MHADRHGKLTEHTDDRTNAQRIRLERAAFFVCEDGACWWGWTSPIFQSPFSPVIDRLKPQERLLNFSDIFLNVFMLLFWF